MSAEQLGVYFSLCCANWTTGGPLEADPDKLKFATGFGRKTINAVVPGLIEMGKVSAGKLDGKWVIWVDRTQADVEKIQGKEARKAPPAEDASHPEIRKNFAKIERKSAKDRRKIGGKSAEDRGSIGDVPPISSEKRSDNKGGERHARATTNQNHIQNQKEGGREESLVAAREAGASPSSSSGLFSLDEQGAGLVRNGSAFKWLDPKTGEPRRLTFQFIETLAPQEPRALLIDFVESELLAAIETGKDGGLHGIIRSAISKGRLAEFKRRRLAPAAAGPDIEPEAPPPISEGRWH